MLAVESEADLVLALRQSAQGGAAPGASVLCVGSSGCRPCARFQPHYERAADAHPRVRFMRVDTDAGPAAAALCAERLGVQATPSFVFYVRGAEVARMRGADPARFEAQLAEVEAAAAAAAPAPVVTVQQHAVAAARSMA